ncbi:MAG TPA: hypothetical protein ENK57_08580 [Polyangiaceae bacterium]|nr:hypothetical protein [Polyangiaceae bacterium]
MNAAIVDHVAARCRQEGLDLTHGLSLEWLDEGIREQIPGSIPDALGLLIGNTRAIWPFVRRARRARHPVDEHCERVIEDAVVELDARVYYAHRRYGGAYLPFQRIAHQAGMLHLSPSHLSLHPVHGPWVALRALVVLEIPAPAQPATSAPDPCTPCDAPCMIALERARDGRDDSDAWRRWLAVRDACPIGRASRYSEPQIAYHYTKEALWLDVDEGDDR